MADFDAATVQLQRELLATTHRDLARDRRLLDKQPLNSRSKMAASLRERIATGSAIVRDLQQLIASMESAAAEPVLDERAQWIADGRTVLDLIEANPGLPLGSFRVAVHASRNFDDDAAREFVDAAAAILGIDPTTSEYGQHYSVIVLVGRAEYEVVHVPSATMARHHEINRLGRAAIAEQDGIDAEGGATR